MTESLTHIGANQGLIAGKSELRCDPFEVFHHIFGHADTDWNHRTIFLKPFFQVIALHNIVSQ